MARIEPRRANGRTVDLPTLASGAVEDVSRRGANHMCFDVPGRGRRDWIVGGPMNYRDGDDWKEYDLRIQPTAEPGWDFEMGRASYRLLTRTHCDDVALMRLEKDGHWLELDAIGIDWAWPQGMVAPGHTIGQVVNGPDTDCTRNGIYRWVNAFGAGRNLVIRPLENRVAKEIVLRSRHMPHPSAIPDEPPLVVKWSFETDVEVYVGGELWDGDEVMTDAAIEFRDGDGLCWKWNPPTALDANRDLTNGQYRLSTVGDTAYVELLFDFAWMRDAEYPVTVDPDIYYSDTDDKYIYGANAVYATAHTTSTGDNKTNDANVVGQRLDGDHRCYRSYLVFDTSTITASFSVLAASLTMTCVSDQSTTDFDVLIRSQDWGASREADYDGALTASAVATWRSTSGIAEDTPYTTAVLPAGINKTGDTKYSLISSRDLAATVPTGYERILLGAQEYATQAHRPYLTITTKGPLCRVNLTIERYEAGLEYWIFNWTSCHDGDASLHLGNGREPEMLGVIDRIETAPSAAEAPTANYDVYLRDLASQSDLLQGAGTNRHTSNEESAAVAYSSTAGSSAVVVTGGLMELCIANAGERKHGTAIIVVRP